MSNQELHGGAMPENKISIVGIGSTMDNLPVNCFWARSEEPGTIDLGFGLHDKEADSITTVFQLHKMSIEQAEATLQQLSDAIDKAKLSVNASPEEYHIYPVASYEGASKRTLAVVEAIQDILKYRGEHPAVGDTIRVAEGHWVRVIGREIVPRDVFFEKSVGVGGYYFMLRDCDSPIEKFEEGNRQIPTPNDHFEYTHLQVLKMGLNETRLDDEYYKFSR